jgi:hypothetical protein
MRFSKLAQELSPLISVRKPWLPPKALVQKYPISYTYSAPI